MVDCHLQLRADCAKEARLLSGPSSDSLNLGTGAGPMIGQHQRDQPELFYGFYLERHVSVDHLLGSIGRFVDLGCYARSTKLPMISLAIYR